MQCNTNVVGKYSQHCPTFLSTHDKDNTEILIVLKLSHGMLSHHYQEIQSHHLSQHLCSYSWHWARQERDSRHFSTCLKQVSGLAQDSLLTCQSAQALLKSIISNRTYSAVL
jgi:hypothetical protein